MHRENLAGDPVPAVIVLFSQLTLDFNVCAKTCAAFSAAVADKRYHARTTINVQ
jgi:hypothetical protein